MTKFEQIGVERQQLSGSVYECKKNFSYSCRLCCEHGLRIECNRCAIATAHNDAVAVLSAIANDKAKIARPVIYIRAR